MELKGRAFFNLLKYSLRNDPSIQAEPWQVEDYRKLSQKKLFERLALFNIHLDPEQVVLYAERVESPEELVEIILPEEKDPMVYDQVYLLLFEAWRRYASTYQTLSIFCDELDHLIDLYERKRLRDEEPLQLKLLQLQNIFDENVDEGGEVKEMLPTISDYLGHNLESFIYDFILHQIEEEQITQASELLDGLGPYMRDKLWFELLRVRIVAETDTQDASLLLDHLIEKIKETPRIDLILETLHFLIYIGDKIQIASLFHLALQIMHREEDLQELLMVASEYYSCKEEPQLEHTMKELLNMRRQKKQDQQVTQDDQAMRTLQGIFSLQQS